MNERTTASTYSNFSYARRSCVPLCCLALLLLAACGSKEDAAPPPQDIVGILELPTAHRGSPNAPSGAARVEIGASELRLDGHALATLTEGALAPADFVDGGIPKLRAALTGGRATAVLYVYSATPWRTTVAVLKTLRDGGVHNAVFAVRRVPPPRTKGAPPTSPTLTASFLELRDYQIVPETEGEIAFPGVAPLPWDDVAAQWEAIKSACATSSTSDCMWKPDSIAVGGNTRTTLFSRGDGLKIGFLRVGAPPDVEAPALAPVAQIAGVPALPADPDAEPPPAPPATEASFTLRSGVTIENDSPVSGMMRAVCGSRACGVVVVSDPEQMTMRVLSLIGAAFPEGTAPPAVAIQTPR